MRRQSFRARVLTAVFVMVAACTGDGAAPVARPPDATPPRPSPSATGLCQPFPDRLIDAFVEAYNGRDLGALKELVTAPVVEDPVAGAYGGDSSFDGVEEWAETAWAAGDRMRSTAYVGFHPSKDGFQMLVTRASDRLRDAGLVRVAHSLNAETEGCTIDVLAGAGPVQTMDEPCAFYESFRDVPDIAAAEPRGCSDGSARFGRSAAVAATVVDVVLVWGGRRGGHFTYADAAMDGLLIDARSGRTRRIPPPRMPAFVPEVAAWTGTELVVVGTRTGPDDGVVAAAYSPANGWRRIPFPFARRGGFEGVWTGSELLLWGGPSHSDDPLRSGVAYDPATEEWRTTAPAPGPGRWDHSIVWTGTEMIVFGGGNADSQLEAGLAYDPVTDTWRDIAPSPLSARQWLPLVWTGREVLAWGGSSISRSVADGAAYDPVTDSWRRLPKSPVRARHHHSAVWTGSEAIFFGGTNYRRTFSDAAAYDPADDRWRELAPAPVRPRFGHVAVWTGSRMVVFGGASGSGHLAFGDGASYDPVRDRWRRIVPRFGR